jgi:hypothetical protein
MKNLCTGNTLGVPRPTNARALQLRPVHDHDEESPNGETKKEKGREVEAIESQPAEAGKPSTVYAGSRNCYNLTISS